MQTRLILFDIDETIVYSDGVGRRALESTLGTIFGIPVDSRDIPMSGKTDPQICHEMLNRMGYPAEVVDEKLPLIYALYVENLQREINNARGFGLHKGAVELLQRLDAMSGCHLGLLTGNIEPGARLKLERFGLNALFPTGAFGCDAADRQNLPPIAHERANRHFAREFSLEEIVIIGDAVNDVRCARAYGVKSVITCTGKTPRAELENLRPDFMFDSLADTDIVLESIFS